MKFYYIFCLEELNHVVVMRQYLLPCAVLCLIAQSCPTLCDSMDCSPPCPSVHGDSPGQNTGVGCMPSSRGSFQLKNLTQVSCTAGRFFTIWATREAQEYWSKQPIPSQGKLPHTGIELRSPALQEDPLPAELPGKPTMCTQKQKNLAQGERRESLYSQEQR